MKKENVVIGGLYFVKDTSSLFEIKKEMDNCCQVEGILYTGNEKSKKNVMKASELAPITITEDILHLLSFIEIDGNLEGLPNEHFFELKTESGPIRMIVDKGQFSYVQRMANAFHGCKFVEMPYLHQLQALLAPICPIDIHIIIKHVHNKSVRI